MKSFKLVIASVTLLVPLLVFGFSGKRRISSVATRPLAALSETNGGSASLLETIRTENLGSNLESETFREWLKESAEIYASWAEGKLSSEESAALSATCMAAEPHHPYCPLILASDAPLALSSKSSVGGKQERTASAKTVRQWIRKGSFSKLTLLAPEELRTHFKQVDDVVQFEALSRAVLKAKACNNAYIPMYLGSKSEESFPDPSAIRKSISLYENAATACGESEHASGAAYRLALIQIWQNRHAVALKHLSPLIDREDAKDYRSRSLYWKSHCERTLGKEEEAAKTDRILYTEHPFILHSLVRAEGTQQHVRTLLQNDDNRIQFRSSDAIANRRVLAVEGLILAGEDDLAKKHLRQLSASTETLEPEFQLYVASLLGRHKLHLEKFKLLSALFKGTPSTISRAALHLYYPHKKFTGDFYEKLGLDEFVILSLIRQESAFNERARSPAGALGLMQLMPATARRIEDLGSREELYNGELNVKIGTKYFSKLKEQFGGDVELALAGYNAGPHRVDNWLKRYPIKDRILFLDLIPFKETREYVAHIARNFFWYNLLYRTGDVAQGPFQVFKQVDMFRAPASATETASSPAPEQPGKSPEPVSRRELPVP